MPAAQTQPHPRPSAGQRDPPPAEAQRQQMAARSTKRDFNMIYLPLAIGTAARPSPFRVASPPSSPSRPSLRPNHGDGTSKSWDWLVADRPLSWPASIAVPLLGTLILAAMLLVLDKMLRLFDFVVSAGGPVSVVWRMLANLLPEYLSLGIPIGLMLGILLAFRKLALSSELDALRGDRAQLRPPAARPLCLRDRPAAAQPGDRRLHPALRPLSL